MLKEEYLIHDLAKLAGVSPRTIRYYTQEGLLPEPASHGKFAYYNQEHLARLRLIQKLKISYLPLKEIKQLLNSLTFDEVQAMLQGGKAEKMQQFIMAEPKAKQAQPGSESAVDYIANLLKKQTELRSPAPAKPSAPLPPRQTEPRYAASSPPESWRRIVIAPGVEIQVKEPLSKQDQERLEELISFASRLYSNK